jgi:hypothetical protein
MSARSTMARPLVVHRWRAQESTAFRENLQSFPKRRPGPTAVFRERAAPRRVLGPRPREEPAPDLQAGVRMGRRELAAHLPRKAAIRPIADANAAGQSYENDKRPPSQRRMVAINAEVATARQSLYPSRLERSSPGGRRVVSRYAGRSGASAEKSVATAPLGQRSWWRLGSNVG